MRIFDRHIFGSVFATTLGAVSLLAFVLVAGNMLKDLLALSAAGHLAGWETLKLIALILPSVISYALPMGFLAGVLISFGRMSADLEITAMKCAGLSLWRIAAPVLIVGVFGTLVAALSNTYFGPKAALSYRETLKNMLRADPAALLVARVVTKFPQGNNPQFVLYVGKKEKDQLSDFWVWELDGNGSAKRLLRSQAGTFRFDSQRESLVLSLQGAFFEIRGSGLSGMSPDSPQKRTDGGASLAEFQKIELEIPLGSLLGEKERKRSTLTQSELGDRIEEGRAAIASIPTEKKAERKAAEADLSKYVVRWHRNLAMALCVLPMGILALPLSMKTSRRETYVNAALALGLGLGYYLLMTLAEALQGKPALHPEILIWLPNLMFLALGLRLMRRASAH